MKKKNKHNLNCAHFQCKDPDGEVRCLPEGQGAVTLCFECFKKEMKERRQFNKEAGEKIWTIPAWGSLEVYDVA